MYSSVETSAVQNMGGALLEFSRMRTGMHRKSPISSLFALVNKISRFVLNNGLSSVGLELER